MFRALPIEGHKNIIQPAIFGVSRWLPFEGEKRNLSKWLIFDPSRCLPDGREIFKTIHKNRVFVLYLLEGKIIFRKSLIFSLSRDLPLEGNLQNRHNFWPLPVGTSEGIFKTGVKTGFSLPTLWGKKIFLRVTPQTASLSGNKWRENNSLEPHISNFLAGYSLGEQNFFENTY